MNTPTRLWTLTGFFAIGLMGAGALEWAGHFRSTASAGAIESVPPTRSETHFPPLQPSMDGGSLTAEDAEIVWVGGSVMNGAGRE